MKNIEEENMEGLTTKIKRGDSVKYDLVILGKPTGKARPRVTRWGTHTPEKTVLYENLIKISFQQQNPNKKPLEGYIRAEITAHFKPTKTDYKSKKKISQMLSGEIKPSKKPDIDNIAKIILDALNKIAYKDDTQVVELTVKKVYSEIDKVEVKIIEI